MRQERMNYSPVNFIIMEKDPIEEQPTKEEKQTTHEMMIRKLGEESLVKLRAMPYDNSRVGKSFVILPNSIKETPSSETPVITKTREESLYHAQSLTFLAN